MTAERGSDPHDSVEELRTQLASLWERIEALQLQTADDEPLEEPPDHAPSGEEEPPAEPEPGAEVVADPPEPSPSPDVDDRRDATPPAPPRTKPTTRYSALHAKLAALEEAERRASEEAESAGAPEAPPTTPKDDRAPIAAATPVTPAPDLATNRPPSAIAATAIAWDDPWDEEAHRGVRYSDLSTIASHERRWRGLLPLVAVVALVIAAFAGGAWWAGRDGDGTVATTATPSPDQDEAGAAGEDPPPVSVREPESEASPPSDPTSPPPSTAAPVDTPGVAANPATVVAAAEAALSEAGYSFVTPSYAGGTLILDGVLPAAAVTDGYFGLVDRVAATVADIDGVQSVAPRLFLRGDDVHLRAQLAALSEAQPIEFALGRADLSAAARSTLAEAAAAILENPGLRVLVAGHTDALGSPENNAELASARTASVIQELVALGVPITRLQPVSYGELFPDADLSDEENRRVAFEVAP